MSRRSRQLVATLATALVLMSGCRGPGDQRAIAPTASGTDLCNHPPDTGGGDGGLGAGFGYSDEHHDFGAGAPMTLCMNVPGGSVHVDGSAVHIAVAPETFPGPGTQFTFTVTVSSGPSGGLDLEVVDDDGGVGVQFHGPAIQTDDTGWYFGAERPTTGSRGQQRIVGWSVADETLHLWIDTCDGDPEGEVVESDADVTVTIVSTRRNPGDACQDCVEVTLTEPLGARVLIDGATGLELEPMEG
ncbi:hypothetical protein [uncultured Cellulomonas sp.]|uniref:hypothetical protein n=1 Tax=uncultured Cellulomonas sp. TaxID=189682 RepID=UPI0028E84900|nr:hypothetical protein [uncultured Cellulomonas sp.]